LLLLPLGVDVLLPGCNAQQQHAAAELVLIIKLLLHLRLLFRVWLLSAISSIICFRLFSCFHKKKMEKRNHHKFNILLFVYFRFVCLTFACDQLVVI